MQFNKEVLERFLRYAVIDTMSDDHMAQEHKHPSSEGQWELLKLLEAELKELGLKDVVLDEYGYVLGRLEANSPDLPCIGFSAHVDTADDVDGNHVKPRVIESYDGKDIKLNNEFSIDRESNPDLAGYVGTTLVVTDGNTLLGSDDKAGIAEIMTAIHYLVSHPEIKHGEIEVLFSPDEETGTGMEMFDVKRLHSKAVYTLDGGPRYEVELECFNAATVKVHFSGISYHLGAARGRFVNALTMASAYINSMPQAESPEATDGRYGYYCAQEAAGTATDMDITVYVRDFDLGGLKRRIAVLEQLGKSVEMLYDGGKVTVNSNIIYYNMLEPAKQKPKAKDAVFEAGKILSQPLYETIIRGGTDGARLAEFGIPCPNLYTGGYNIHSRFEWAAVDAMSDATALVVEIVKQWAL